MPRQRTNPVSRGGAYLRELRLRAHLTTAEVAQRSKLTKQRAWDVERGKSVDDVSVVAFARACSATPAELSQVRALAILDRGQMPVPAEASVEQVLDASQTLGRPL